MIFCLNGIFLSLSQLLTIRKLPQKCWLICLWSVSGSPHMISLCIPPELELQGLLPCSKYRQDLDISPSEKKIRVHCIKHATAVIKHKGESQPCGSEGKLSVTASTVAGQQFSFYRGQFINGRRRKDRNYGKGRPSAHSRCNCTCLLQQSLWPESNM